VSEPLPLLTDAELDSRSNVQGQWAGGRDGAASVIPDTLKRAEAAIKRLEKRAKAHPAVPSPKEQTPK
jgi:hypothetical protein